MADELPYHLQGSLEIRKASEINIIQAIQRKPTDDRLRKLARDWDLRKVGVIELARITNGEYKGRLHPVDGGSRVECQKQHGDPEFLFLCVVRPRTFQEAAQEFLWRNGLSMRPSAFSRYAVGIRAGEPRAKAIEKSLKHLKLSGSPTSSTYGNGEDGTFAALAAAERIINSAYRVTESWDEASDHLSWTLGFCRQAYPQHGDKGTAVAHDADLIQAVSVLGMLNERLEEDEVEAHLSHAVTTWLGQSQAKTRLFEYGSEMKPEHWRVALINATKNTGGSSSRGSQMARQIGLNHNQAFTPRMNVPPAAR
jgi:hypothetical protein